MSQSNLKLNHLHLVDQSPADHGYELMLNGEFIDYVKPKLEADNQEGVVFSEEVIAFPGLINSHEHLANNTHPLFRLALYQDYTMWAKDVTHHIQAGVEAIPFTLRYQWGLVKNLLNGFTTIVQHDRFLDGYQSEVVDIDTSTRVIHSIYYDQRWMLKSNWPESKWKIIHLAEGFSDLARNEPMKFLKWTLRPEKTLAVHGVSLKPVQASRFGGLIWCPNSNFTLYGQTANVDTLKHELPILFGTDSTISSDWDLQYHIKQARETSMLTDQELFQSMTTVPAGLFGYQDRGTLTKGKRADLVVARKKKKDVWDAFYELKPEDILLVIKSGRIVLADQSMLKQLSIERDAFESVQVGTSKKYLRFDFFNLSEAIKEYYPDLITTF